MAPTSPRTSSRAMACMQCTNGRGPGMRTAAVPQESEDGVARPDARPVEPVANPRSVDPGVDPDEKAGVHDVNPGSVALGTTTSF
jgi:hypothetical protein